MTASYPLSSVLQTPDVIIFHFPRSLSRIAGAVIDSH